MNIRSTLALATIILVLTACSSGGDGGTPPIIEPPVTTLDPDEIKTFEGVYAGSIESSLVVFRGVPYAEAPTGNLRFRAPTSPVAFTGTRFATDFGANCLQPAGPNTVGDEDCLYLNVWKHNDDVIRPIMVYLHPGAGNNVGGDMASIDAADLAESSDVIVVNFNRRIGALGYLALDELVAENANVTAGNYGLQDVMAALQWIKNNAAAINGDPDRIMIFGTSAGGITTCSLMGAPGMAGLISAAAIQSAPCGSSQLQKLNDTVVFNSAHPPALQSHRGILVHAGCDAAADIPACLRDLTAAEIVEAGAAEELIADRVLYVPIIDGVIVTSDPRTGLQNQTAGDFPLIVGMAENEAAGLFANLTLPDDDAYRAILAAAFPDPVDDQLYALYPSANFATPKDALIALFADVVFSCNAEWLAMSAMDNAPSYVYEIRRGFDAGGFAGRGAVHAIDIPYLFRTFDVYGYAPDDQATAISDAMQMAWSSLAGASPDAPAVTSDGSIQWVPFDTTTKSYIEFGDAITARQNHRDGRCDAVRAVMAP